MAFSGAMYLIASVSSSSHVPVPGGDGWETARGLCGPTPVGLNRHGGTDQPGWLGGKGEHEGQAAGGEPPSSPEVARMAQMISISFVLAWVLSMNVKSRMRRVVRGVIRCAAVRNSAGPSKGLRVRSRTTSTKLSSPAGACEESRWDHRPGLKAQTKHALQGLTEHPARCPGVTVPGHSARIERRHHVRRLLVRLAAVGLGIASPATCRKGAIFAQSR